jgi:hypothetical protein
VQINLGRARTIVALTGLVVFGLLVAGMVTAAITAQDTATRAVGIGFAVLFGIPLVLILVGLRRLTRRSVLGFDQSGFSYSYGGASTRVVWSEIAGIGFAFEVPTEVPSIDLSGILADKVVDDVLKVSKSRKIALEVFPAAADVFDRHAALASYRQQLQPPRDGLSPAIWRMAIPPLPVAKRIAQALQTYAPHLYLGWYQRPWSGSVLGRRDRVA